jgi:hypothetical protein
MALAWLGLFCGLPSRAGLKRAHGGPGQRAAGVPQGAGAGACLQHGLQHGAAFSTVQPLQLLEKGGGGGCKKRLLSWARSLLACQFLPSSPRRHVASPEGALAASWVSVAWRTITGCGFRFTRYYLPFESLRPSLGTIALSDVMLPPQLTVTPGSAQVLPLPQASTACPLNTCHLPQQFQPPHHPLGVPGPSRQGFNLDGACEPRVQPGLSSSTAAQQHNRIGTIPSIRTTWRTLICWNTCTPTHAQTHPCLPQLWLCSDPVVCRTLQHLISTTSTCARTGVPLPHRGPPIIN